MAVNMILRLPVNVQGLPGAMCVAVRAESQCVVRLSASSARGLPSANAHDT